MVESDVPARRTALITGASRGIGRRIAARLAHEGYDVTLSARDATGLRATAATLDGTPGRVSVCTADMADPDQIATLASTQLKFSPMLNVLVLCAGMGTAGALDTYPRTRVDRQLAVNLLGPLTLVQSLLPALRSAAAGAPTRGAKIIAIASMTAVASEPGLAVYGATKAALVSLCESITVEEAENGVTATAISPGFVNTDMTEWVRDRLAPQHMIAPDDVAELALATTRLSRNAAVPHFVVTRPGASLWRA